jgi:hypothetical protein
MEAVTNIPDKNLINVTFNGINKADLRCPKCGRLLGKTTEFTGEIEIKCTACKKISIFASEN